MNEIHPDRSLGSLFNELTRETSTLFRQEIQLAKAEVAEKAKQAGSGAAMAVAGGLILFVALIALAATFIIALSYVMEPWLAALVVTVVLAVIGGIVLSKGLSNLKGDNLTPRRTIDTMRANAQFAREQLR